MNKNFIKFTLQNKLLNAFCTQTQSIATIHGWDTRELLLDDEGTHFFYIFKDETEISFTLENNKSITIIANEGFYGSIPGKAVIKGGAGFISTKKNWKGTFMLGGPIENYGRLSYIDGCSDSLLVPPIKKGDACLNLLHFPKNISQTQHTHPSLRCGIVVRGCGRCEIPSEDFKSKISIPLEPGDIFFIPSNGLHSFFTDNNTMDVVAYHPDSDTGPTDDDHPMLNRTIVEGISASNIFAIRTSKIAL